MPYTKWVAAWGNAPSRNFFSAANYAKNITLRYVITTPFDGSHVRLTFSNLTGADTVKLTRVTVAKSVSKTAVAPETLRDVTFGGRQEGVMPAGQGLVSDEIPFEVKRGDDLAVSIYLGDYAETTCAVSISGPLVRNTVAQGDFAGSADLPIDLTAETGWYYYLTDLDVLTEEKNHALITFGDSITSQSWPDYLTLRTFDEKLENVSVVRKAVSGSRILRQYDCVSYRQYGLKGTDRFEREIAVAGADAVVVLHGINDMIHPDGVNPFRPMSDMPTAQNLIDGLRVYIDAAHRHGLKIYLGTVLPIEGWRTYEAFRNEVRLELNEWIRTTDEIDGVVDFDAEMRNPGRPNALQEGFDSGDHLHPGMGGAQKMASLIPENLLG